MKAAARFILFCAWLVAFALMTLAPALTTFIPLMTPPPAPPPVRDPNDHQVRDTR